MGDIHRGNHITKKEEKDLRIEMKQRARKECEYFTQKYDECSVGTPIFTFIQCHKQSKELKDCLHQFDNNAVLEVMKRNYMLEQEDKKGGRP